MKQAVKKNSTTTINKKNPDKRIGSDEVKDYSNDPAFIKMANESKVFLEKHGFPEELLRKRV
jgi:hypothetical protein